MQLDVTPEALAAASGQVAALTGRLIAANAAHIGRQRNDRSARFGPGVGQDCGSLQAGGMPIGDGCHGQLSDGGLLVWRRGVQRQLCDR